MNKKEKKELLIKSNFFKNLTIKQLWNLSWWETFKPRKTNKFFEMLEIGKSAKFAYEDALECK